MALSAVPGWGYQFIVRSSMTGLGMAEIVLSFAQHEKSRVAPMRDALRRVWLMWWDNDIGAGKPWAEAWARFVDMELANAKCVVAVWSTVSIESSPVHHCARVGQRRGCLLQVLLDGAEPPREFDAPSVDLATWNGRLTDPTLGEITAGVRRIVGSDGMAALREASAEARLKSHTRQVMALAGSDIAEARDFYDRGFKHSLSENFSGTIAECSKAIEIDPAFAQAYKTRAVAYYQSQLYDRAIDDSNRLIELAPGYFGGHSLRGLARVRSKDYDNAIPDFNRAIALEAEHGGTYYGLGLAYHGKEAYDAAIASYTEAIGTTLKSDGVPARYYFARASAYEERGLAEDMSRAEVDYLRALQAYPPKVEAEERLARICGA